MKLAYLAILITMVSGTSKATAQVFLPPPPPPLSLPDLIWNSHMMRQLGTNATGQAVFGEQLQRDLANRLKRDLPKTNGAPNTGATPARGATPGYSSALSYPFSGTHVLPAKIAAGQSGAKTPFKTDDLNRLVASLWSAYQTSFREEHERLKMPVSDVASAMTYCIIMNYMVYNNIQQVDASRSVAVYHQASRILLDNPEFSKFGASDKQALAEVLVAMGGMPAMTSQLTRDAAQGRKVAENTLVNLFGAQAAAIKITESGLEF
jgi:hypothetical protein